MGSEMCIRDRSCCVGGRPPSHPASGQCTGLSDCRAPECQIGPVWEVGEVWEVVFVVWFLVRWNQIPYNGHPLHTPQQRLAPFFQTCVFAAIRKQERCPVSGVQANRLRDKNMSRKRRAAARRLRREKQRVCTRCHPRMPGFPAAWAPESVHHMMMKMESHWSLIARVPMHDIRRSSPQAHHVH